jgi:Tfp pilus assembly protein PilX
MMTLSQNCRNRKRKNHGRQRGVALVAALLTLVLISAITAGMIIMSTTETSISANFRDEQTGFFASKAGIEEARDRLGALRAAPGLPTVTPGSANGVLYLTNPDTTRGETAAQIFTLYPDDEICKETQTTAVPCQQNPMNQSQMIATPGGWETTVAASPTYAPVGGPFPWKWVRINLKQNNQNNGIAPAFNTNGLGADASVVCWNGTSEYADLLYTPAGGCTAPYLPVYVLTALAVTPSGTRRMIQQEVSEQKFPFTAPGALTMLDSLPNNASFSGGSSAQWGSNGNDAAGCGQPAGPTNVHGIAVADGTVGPPLTGDLLNVDNGLKRPANITGSGGNLPDGANVVNVSSTGDNTLPMSMQSVSNLQDLVSQVKAAVTQPALNCPPSSGGCSGLANPGTQANPQIIYVNGDLTITGNLTGYGVLVVTGTLTMKGTPQWNGIVLVVGQGNLQTSGTTSYNGAVVVAKTVDASGNPLPTFGAPTISVNGGGHGGIQYSSGCVNMALKNFNVTFQTVAVRELMR